MPLFGNDEDENDEEDTKKERSYTIKELKELAKIFRSAVTKKKK